MFKKFLATLGLCALCVSAPLTAHAAVYVEGADTAGEWEDEIIWRIDITPER